MSDWVEKDMTGKLWENGFKEDGHNQPVKTGTCTLGGVQYKISAWDNTSKNGKPYLGLVFQVKEVTIVESGAEPF